jgi:hypothetical protein
VLVAASGQLAGIVRSGAAFTFCGVWSTTLKTRAPAGRFRMRDGHGQARQRGTA